jgi:hypothetical protein
MGMNTASITAKMRVPNQSVSDVILEPRGSISETFLLVFLQGERNGEAA